MKKLLMTVILTVCSHPLHAETSFTYAGKPISSNCFAKLLNPAENNQRVLLANCSGNGDKASARYTVISSNANKYLIAAGVSTGGSGDFTSIIWVEKTNDSLIILKNVASGDRCNGGTEKFSAWQYAVNLSPVDMLGIASGPPLKLNDYKDLDASASSCVAKAIYKFDPATAKASLIKVNLYDRHLAIDNAARELNYQPCFNALYNNVLDNGKITLTANDLDHFKNQFEAICMASSA